jgi:hypothetical protein
LKNSTKRSKNSAKRLKIFEDFGVLRYPSQKNGTFTSLQFAQMIGLAPLKVIPAQALRRLWGSRYKTRDIVDIKRLNTLVAAAGGGREPLKVEGVEQ